MTSVPARTSSVNRRNGGNLPTTADHDKLLSPLESRIDISKAVQTVKQYLERSSDLDMAYSCLETLVKVGSAFGNECDVIQQCHILETILVVLDILHNHHQDVNPSLQRLVLDYVGGLDFEQSSSSYAPDLHCVFLIKCIKSDITLSLLDTRHNDTLEGLIFDFGSILLSHSKYEVVIGKS
jgi:hypothetical protein